MGGSGLGVDPHQELAEALLGQQVEPDGRLVEEEDGGLVEHARHQLAAHPLAEREVADRDVEQLGGIEQLGQLVEAGGLPAPLEAVDRRQHAQGLAGRELEPQLRALAEEGADPGGQAPTVAIRHEAEDARPPRRGVEYQVMILIDFDFPARLGPM